MTKHDAIINAALNRLKAGEKYVMIELPSLTYRQANLLRGKAKYFAKSCKGFQLHTRTIQLKNMTLLFVAVK